MNPNQGALAQAMAAAKGGGGKMDPRMMARIMQMMKGRGGAPSARPGMPPMPVQQQQPIAPPQASAVSPAMRGM